METFCLADALNGPPTREREIWPTMGQTILGKLRGEGFNPKTAVD
jgi:hypothetical protein